MRKKFLSIVLCVCMMLTMVLFAFAAEDTSFNLTEAIQNAKDNDTIMVPSGEYVLSGSLPYAGKALTIKAEDNATVSIDMSNATATANAELTFEGITFNYANKNYTGLQHANKLTYNNCIINGLATLYAKQEIYNQCTFNQTTEEYNVWCYGAGEGYSESFTGCTFNGYGKFVHVYRENDNPLSVTLTDCTFNNKADKAVKSAVNVKEGCSNGKVLNNTVAINNCTTTGEFPTDKLGNSELYMVDNHVTENANTTVSIDGKTVWKNGAPAVDVAEVNGVAYTSLEDAITAANSGDTVTLLDNATVSEQMSIEKDITLSLNGHNVSACAAAFKILANGSNLGGSLKVTGAGTIDCGSNYATFYLIGTETSDSQKYAKLVIGKDVNIINGQYAFWIDSVSSENNTSYNVSIDISGNVTGVQPIYVSGNIHASEGNIPVINIHNGATFDFVNDGIYLAGYVKTVIDDGVSMTNTSSNVINIAAGEMVINGGTFVGGNTIGSELGTGGAINISTSSAVYIQQHSTNLPTKVTINGGTFIAAVPFYQEKGAGNSAPQLVELAINGGNFASNRSIADGGVAVKSDDKTGFISGGYFTSDPSDYCVDGKTGVPSGNSNYPFTVGDINAAVKVAEGKSDAQDAPANSTFDNSLAKETVKEVASSATASLSGASGDVAQNIDDSTVTEATNKLGSLVTSSNTVVVLVQPYLEITPTGSTATSISLNIEPKYNLIATTSNVDVNSPESIVTDNTATATKNAAIIEAGKALTVTTPTPVTLTLPTTFASPNTSVYIKHEAGNGKIYYYTAIVGDDYKITFTTKNGFSPFTISTTSEAVAEVDGIGYATFQDAVDAVENNGTIKALQDITSTVSGNKTFTVNSNGKNVSLTAASGYNLTSTPGGTSDITTYTVSRQHSSSSGSTSTTYAVNVNAATNGAVAADKKTAAKGDTVTVTVTPSTGYVVDAVKVVDKDGKDVAVSEKDGKYLFTMPASAVTVTAVFKAETPAPSALPFVDVKSGDWFYDAVKYAYENGLMNGTGETVFAPNGTMNRAMIVTVLYRLEKSPAVTTPAQFKDVPAGQWYSDAVAWAAANNIVNGYDETTFGPLNAVTREQMAAILYRYEQYKGMDTVTLEENLARFPDKDKVSAYAVPAMQWAVGQKVINGNADGTLDPTGTATRAQVAQIFSNLLNQ